MPEKTLPPGNRPTQTENESGEFPMVIRNFDDLDAVLSEPKPKPEAVSAKTQAEIELVENARKRFNLMLRDPEYAIEQIKLSEQDPENEIALNALVRIWAQVKNMTLIDDPLVAGIVEDEEAEAQKNRFVRAWNTFMQSNSEAKRELLKRVMDLAKQKNALQEEIAKAQSDLSKAQEALEKAKLETAMEKQRRETFLSGDVNIMNRPEYKLADENLASLLDLLKRFRKRTAYIDRPLSIADGISTAEIAQISDHFSMQISNVLKEAEWKFGKPTRARMALQLLEKHGLELTQLYFRYKHDQLEPHFGGDHLSNCLKTLSDPSVGMDEALSQFTASIESLKAEIVEKNNFLKYGTTELATSTPIPLKK